MPCYDPRNDEYDNLVRRFCCETISKMEENGEPIPDYIKEWWKDHQAYDRAHGRPHKEGYHAPKVKK